MTHTHYRAIWDRSYHLLGTPDHAPERCLSCLAERLSTPDMDVRPAGYADGKLLVRSPSGDGWKTHASRLCEAFGGRYTGRERGYIMTPAAVRKVRAAFEAGYDADIFGNLIAYPDANEWRMLTAEAL